MNDRDRLSERLVQAACDPRGLERELGAEDYMAFVSDPAHAAEIETLRGFLGGVRADLVATAGDLRAPHAVRRVTRRVLARTTREERGWRGDLRLVGDFVSDRLRASVWLRVAAAILLVQVTVVPLLAWHLLKGPERSWFNLSFTAPEPAPPFVDPPEEPPLVIEAPLGEELGQLAEPAAEGALAGGRRTAASEARFAAAVVRGVRAATPLARELQLDPSAMAAGLAALAPAELALAARALYFDHLAHGRMELAEAARTKLDGEPSMEFEGEAPVGGHDGPWAQAWLAALAEGH